MPSLELTPAKTLTKPRAVALVVHGLNYRPDRMRPVVDCLSEAGVECIALSLHGHGDNYTRVPGADADSLRLHAYRRVTTDLWLYEVCAAYAIARERANQMRAPLFYSGYSLGGLLGCLAMKEKAWVRFDGMLLFAPALALGHYSVAMLLAMWLPNVDVPSLSPIYYRANRASPASAYLALFKGIERLHAGSLRRMNVPSLVFMDKRDELVSYRGVRSIAKNLTEWSLYRIQKSAPVAGHVFHHLVIGNEAVGVETWTAIRQRMTEFVLRRCDAFR